MIPLTRYLEQLNSQRQEVDGGCREQGVGSRCFMGREIQKMESVLE